METKINTLQNRYKIYNIILTVSSIAAMLSAVWDDAGRLLPAVSSTELNVRTAESHPMFVFSIFVRVFLDN